MNYIKQEAPFLKYFYKENYKELNECIEQVEQMEGAAATFNNSKKTRGLTNIFRESALTIMHCQHDKECSIVLANFSFLPHILQ